MMTRDFLSLSLSLSLSLFFASRQKNKDERERERARKRRLETLLRDVSKSSASLSLSLSRYVYINLKRKPPFCFGESLLQIFVSLSNVCKSDVCVERKKNETKERASAARDARENGGDE